MPQKTQSFNDGVVKIYQISDVSSEGDMPKEGLLLKHTLRYAQRTVGLTRYYQALQANVRVKHLVRCHCVDSVSTQDVAVPADGKQYRIIQIQYPEDVNPPVMDLTLEAIEQEYEVM